MIEPIWSACQTISGARLCSILLGHRFKNISENFNYVLTTHRTMGILKDDFRFLHKISYACIERKILYVAETVICYNSPGYNWTSSGVSIIEDHTRQGNAITNHDKLSNRSTIGRLNKRWIHETNIIYRLDKIPHLAAGNIPPNPCRCICSEYLRLFYCLPDT